MCQRELLTYSLNQPFGEHLIMPEITLHIWYKGVKTYEMALPTISEVLLESVLQLKYFLPVLAQ